MIKMLSRLLLLSASRPAVTAAWMHQASRRVALTATTTTATTALRYQTTSTTSEGTSDDSAMSRSRAPFRMPRNSADDSVPTKTTTSATTGITSVSSWNQLGLWTELVDALEEMKLDAPTPVQNLVIPNLLQERVVDTAFLAATGSGKTLYVLLDCKWN